MIQPLAPWSGQPGRMAGRVRDVFKTFRLHLARLSYSTHTARYAAVCSDTLLVLRTRSVAYRHPAHDEGSPQNESGMAPFRCVARRS